MSFRVQITPITGAMMSQAGVGFQTQALSNLLKHDLADEAQRIISRMQEYPGETHETLSAGLNRKITARYRRTGQLQIPTRRGYTLEYNRRGRFLGRTINTPDRGEYIRTGLLGQSWTYEIKEGFGGGLGLLFNNTAHDRPGNYYAGWVNGFQPADARGRYHQAAWHADAGWASFSKELSKSDIKDAAQDTINDYLKNLGLM